MLDITMPDMDGFELLNALRGRDGLAELPIIFLSARVQESDIEGVSAVFRKLCRAAEVRTIRLHDVRHSRQTRAWPAVCRSR